MKSYGIFGYPIEHSLSPAMQNAAFRALGLNACYHPFRVAPDDLEDALDGARAMGFSGLNLTIPLKERALAYLTPDSVALEMGAINTVVPAKMRGFNTDGLGAKLALEGAGVALKGEKVLVIGSGGAARAIAFMLAQEGAEIAIANRGKARAVDLASRSGADGFGLDELERLVTWADLIINATSIGMSPGDARLIDPRWLRKEKAVFDIVYNRKTELLMDAERAGCPALDGVSMLVGQGAASFRIWTGLEAPVDTMERAVREALGGRR